jgi:predicted O-linked N-acetylglucosamine transferase (SPINDLY family)
MFAANPQTALDKVNRKIADIDANLADLATKRATLLSSLDDDSVSAVQSLDKAAEAERAARVILADKAKALAEEVRKTTYAQREKDRRTSIEKIKGALKTREKVAAELQAAIERVGELYTQLITPDEVEISWPFPRPGNKFAELDFRGVRREISWALHGLVHQFRLPEPSSAGLGVVGITAQGIDGVVRQQNEAIVSRLETVSIADDLLDEAI